MSETVGQHSVATFTSPVNGTSPIDANTVKGNDNTIRSAYVDHDADPGIHVQSSTLASRPVANSAGRKWMTQDSGVIRLFYDDGTSWYEVDYLRTTGGAISGNLSISGTLAVTGVATLTAQPILSSLTASQAVFTDASKGLVSNAITGTGNVVMSASPTLTGTIGAASMTLSGTLGVTGLLTFASLKGTGATTVTNILDEDNMASDSATALATQQSIKAYVDAQVGASDALSEVLAIGNTTGANDIIVSAGQKIRTPAVAAGDGTSAITIANTTGALTLASALADSNLATISTAGKVSNSATTATSANTASAIVARDSSGDFAAGTITANLTGNISGTAPAGTLTGTTLASNVVSSSLTSVGTLTSGAIGSGFTAIPNSALANSSVTVNGTAIALGASGTVTAAAGTLTGTTLASNVVSSSLTSVGTLSSLTVSGDLTVDTSTLKVDSTNNRVGIGTTSPDFPLDVVRGSTGTVATFGIEGLTINPRLRIDASEADNTVTLNPNYNGAVSPALTFKTAEIERLRIDASGNLAVDTNTLYVDAVNNRVGIGTASPSTNLHVSGSGSVINLTETSTQYAITRLKNPTHSSDVGVDNTSMYLDSGGAYPIIFYTGAVSTEKMRLDASGNLGLGVTPSASTIPQFEGGSNLLLTGRGNSYLSNNVTYNGGWKYIATAVAAQYNISGAEHRWYNAPSGTAGNTISWTQAMTLAASDRGTLGVGPSATSPQSIGSNFATVDIRNTTGGGVIFGNPTDYGYLYADSTSTNLATTTAKPLTFLTNGTERARITSGGNFLHGTTDPGLTTGVGYKSIYSATNPYTGIVITGSTNTETNWHLYSTGAAAYRFYVGGAGTVFATNTTISAISDARLKENVRDLDVGLDAILALRPRTFDWKEGKGSDVKDVRGFIAQEFEEVFPDLIDEWKDPAPEGEEPYKSVRQDLIPVLVKAIQELNAKNASLEARLAALEN